MVIFGPPIGWATESELQACIGHLLICQVTKRAVTAESIHQLCPHGPLSWPVFQRADRLIRVSNPMPRRSSLGLNICTKFPVAKGGWLCLTKTDLILQANGQFYQLLDSVLKCLGTGVSVSPTGDLAICPPAFYLCFTLLLPWALWALASFGDLFRLWAGQSQQVFA